MSVRHFLLVFLLVFVSISAYSQLKMDKYGKLEIGEHINTGSAIRTNSVAVINGALDIQNYCWDKLYPKYPGANISFRNIAISKPSGLVIYTYANEVLVGEYMKENPQNSNSPIVDTDQLWLHGKKGLYITRGYYGNDIIGYYDANLGNYFQFNCDVRSTGVFVASDSRFKENVKPLKNTLEGLKQLSAVSYKLKDISVENKSEKNTVKAGEAEEIQSVEEPTRFGFIAQEVEKVFPELISKDKETGYMYVDYIGMIPLIVNALNEYQNKLEDQKAYISDLESRIEKLEGVINTLSSVTKDALGIDSEINNGVSVLFPNSPNPFKSETKISFVLTETVKSAVLYIYDMQGKQLKEYKIAERGENSIYIKGSELESGMYIYTLIADGKEIGTHRMILTK